MFSEAEPLSWSGKPPRNVHPNHFYSMIFHLFLYFLFITFLIKNVSSRGSNPASQAWLFILGIGQGQAQILKETHYISPGRSQRAAQQPSSIYFIYPFRVLFYLLTLKEFSKPAWNLTSISCILSMGGGLWGNLSRHRKVLCTRIVKLDRQRQLQTQ